MRLSRIRWRGIFRWTPAGEESDGLVDRVLDSVRRADPDTEHAWSRLAVHLDADPVRLRRVVRTRSVIPLRPVLWSGLALAAAAAVVFLIPHEADRVYMTARGQQSTVLLPDSTVVTLNHTSTLTVQRQRGDGQRLVTLEGEAYFQVRHNGTPFIVGTKAGIVQVLGTAFNVKAREQVTDLEVLQGRVRFGEDGSGRSVILTQNQRSRCVAGGTPAPPAPVAYQTAPDWMVGKMVCNQRELSDICGELEETYDVSIAIEDPSLRRITVTGTIEARSADKALQAVCLLTGHRYRQDHATFVLY